MIPFIRWVHGGSRRLVEDAQVAQGRWPSRHQIPSLSPAAGGLGTQARRFGRERGCSQKLTRLTNSGRSWRGRGRGPMSSGMGPTCPVALGAPWTPLAAREGSPRALRREARESLRPREAGEGPFPETAPSVTFTEHHSEGLGSPQCPPQEAHGGKMLLDHLPDPLDRLEG